MSLHVPTLFVAIFAAFALFAATLGLARTPLRDCAELRTWAWGTWALVAGFIVLVARVLVPEWVAVLFGNGLVAVSLFLISQALHRFVLQRDAPRWQAALMGAGWVLGVLIVKRPIDERTLAFSALFALQLLPPVWLIGRRGWHAEPSLHTVAVTLGLTVVALTWRAFDAFAHPDDYREFFQASLGNGLTYLASYLFPLGAGFGFVLANLERAALRLHELATHDSLTGCITRGTFDSLLQHARDRARREGAPVSLVIIDLDEFKQVNDLHGHPAGDLVLLRCADAVRARLRASDVFARLGGEEFAVILPATDAGAAMDVAESLRATIAALELSALDGARLRVTASFGVASAAPGSDLSNEGLYAQADKALYEAKHAGKNRAACALA